MREQRSIFFGKRRLDPVPVFIRNPDGISPVFEDNFPFVSMADTAR